MDYAVKITYSDRAGELYTSEKPFETMTEVMVFWDKERGGALADKDSYLQTNDGFLIIIKNRNTGMRVKLELITFGILATEPELKNYSSEILTSTLNTVEQKIEQERWKNKTIVKKNGSLTHEEISTLWMLEDIAEDISDEINSRSLV